MSAAASVFTRSREEDDGRDLPFFWVQLATQIGSFRYQASHWEGMYRWAVEKQRKLEREVEELRAKLRLRERQLFGRKSEQGSRRFKNTTGAPTSEKRRRGKQRGSRGWGRKFRDLLVVEEERDFSENEKRCPFCQKPWSPFPGTEDSEVVEIEVKAYRRRIRRKRYQPSCHCSPTPQILTTPPPPKLIPKGGFGISFWVTVLIDKFLLQRPTSRLLFDFRTYGLDVSPGTIAGGLKRLLPLFKPLYQAILVRNTSETRWHADETRWLVFVEQAGKANHRWYLWVIRSQTTVVFRLDPSRSSSVVLNHFGPEAEGILNVDRYAAYKTLSHERKIQLSFCWAHVRRDFLGVIADWPGEEGWGIQWIDKIRDLYRLNRERLSVSGDAKALRKAQVSLEGSVLAREKEWREELADPSLPAVRRKVLESLREHWEGLTVFVDHPEVPMDNNQAERDLRGPVIGRKNYYGSGSRWSGEMAAILFSLFQTLSVWKINPREWLTSYLTACAENGGKPPPNASSFLPWRRDTS